MSLILTPLFHTLPNRLLISSFLNLIIFQVLSSLCSFADIIYHLLDFLRYLVLLLKYYYKI
ncbi:MAG: hypothetical protein OHM57_07985 [Spiroplasma phoeniceum]|nr:MAG: hypothetical protein OHM57_07985 [Spiroplasma phoeniceum]